MNKLRCWLNSVIKQRAGTGWQINEETNKRRGAHAVNARIKLGYLTECPIWNDATVRLACVRELHVNYVTLRMHAYQLYFSRALYYVRPTYNLV